LEPFCSSKFDLVSTSEWLATLSANKTMMAHILKEDTLEFEEAVLLDEEVKKEYEN